MNRSCLSHSFNSASLSASLCSVSWTTMTPTGLKWYWVGALHRQRACTSMWLWIFNTKKKKHNQVEKWQWGSHASPSYKVHLLLHTKNPFFVVVVLSIFLHLLVLTSIFRIFLPPHIRHFPLSWGLGTLGRASPAGCVGRALSLIHPQRALWLNRLAQGHGAELREEGKEAWSCRLTTAIYYWKKVITEKVSGVS